MLLRNVLGEQRQALAALLEAVAVWGMLSCAATAEEYRLAPGDVLRVTIVGAPELAQDVPVEMDGSAWFPLVGAIAAGGMTLAELRDSTAEAYATTSLGWGIDPAQGLPKPVGKEQVHLSVGEYRPIYVSGDAGLHEVPFRPGMTLRHVLALASGAVSRGGPLPASPTEVEAAALALAHERARIWRLKSFLGTAEADDYDQVSALGVPGLAAVVDVERSILEEAQDALAKQKEHLRGEVARLEARIRVLERQMENERNGLGMDEEDLANVRDLFDKGLVPASRLAEVRRAALVTGSRALEVEVALENARAQAAEREAEIVALESEARTRAWEELGEAMVHAEERRADLASLMPRAGAAAAEALGAEPSITVRRDGVVLDAELSLPLWPGDIVEITPFAPAAASDAADTGASG